MNDIKVTMRLERLTKGAALYKNEREGEAVTNIYLRKDGLPTPPPETIEIRIQDAGEGE